MPSTPPTTSVRPGHPGVAHPAARKQVLEHGAGDDERDRDAEDRPAEGVVAGHGPQPDSGDDEDQPGEHRHDHAD